MNSENIEKVKSAAGQLDSSVVETLKSDRSEVQDLLSQVSTERVEDAKEAVQNLKEKINNAANSLSHDNEVSVASVKSLGKEASILLSLIDEDNSINDRNPAPGQAPDGLNKFVDGLVRMKKVTEEISSNSFYRDYPEYKHVTSSAQNIDDLISQIEKGNNDIKEIKTKLEELNEAVSLTEASHSESFETSENELIRLSVVCGKIAKLLD